MDSRLTRDGFSWASFFRKGLVSGVLFIFATLPLVYFPGWVGPYITSKEYFFIGLVDILVCAWVWLMQFDRQYCLTLKNGLMLLPLLLFLVSLTISSVIGVDPATSFWSVIESGTGMVLLWHAFFFACIVASLVRVQGDGFFKKILQANFIPAVVLAILTFFARSHINPTSVMLHDSIGGATMGHVLLAAAYLIFSFFLSVILIARESSWKMKILYLVGVVIILVSPPFLNDAIWEGHVPFVKMVTSPIVWIGKARFPAVSFAIGIFFSICLWAFLVKKKKIIRVVSVVGMIFVVLATAFAIEQTIQSGTALNKIFAAESGNRIIFWDEAIQGFKDKPMMGWGQENYRIVYQKYLNPIIFSPGRSAVNEVWSFHPHNVSLEVLVNGGLVGFILYLAFIATMIVGMMTLYRQKKMDATMLSMLLGMMIAYFLQIQMMFDSIVNFVMLFSVLGIIAGLSQNASFAPSQAKISNRWEHVLPAVVTAIMIPVWIYAAYLPAQKVKEMNAIVDSSADSRMLSYYHLFHSPGSYVITTDMAPFVDALIQAYGDYGKSTPAMNDAMAKDVLALMDSIDPIWQKRQMDYHLALSLVSAGNFIIYLTNDATPEKIAQLKQYAEQAILLSPTDPQIYTKYAETLFNVNDLAGANSMVEKALAMNPFYSQARRLYPTARLLAYRQKEKIADLKFPNG